MTDAPETPRWHQALAYAVTGRRLEELGQQSSPDPFALAVILQDQGLVMDSGSHLVPADLMSGLGPAQFLAALAQLRSALAPAPLAAPILADRPLTVDERRLLSDVPPHHGV